jgi:hypothetical protein
MAISSNKNPYVFRADMYVNEKLSGPYTCWHKLRIKRHKPGLYFYHYSEFDYEYQLLERLLKIRRFYLDGIEELKAELKQTTMLTVVTPKFIGMAAAA